MLGNTKFHMTQAIAEGVRTRLQEEIQALRGSMDSLERVSQSVAETQADQLSEMAEKDQRRVRFEVKTDSYMQELSSLQAKLKKVGFADEVIATRTNVFTALQLGWLPGVTGQFSLPGCSQIFNV